MNRLLFLVLIFCSLISSGQMYKRKKMPLVDLNGSFKMKHFYISPGLTFMNPNFIKKRIDTMARGRIGINMQVGMYKIFKGGGNIFNYADYGIGYKKYSGSEFINIKNIFKQHYISLDYNINSIYQLTSKKFFQSSIGANLDWKFAEKQKENILPNNTNSVLLSIHLKFGFGIKYQNRLFIIPTIETPILNLTKWENGKSTYGIFNSRYRPFVICLKFLWLKRPSKGDCPPVKLNSEDKARYQNNYMQ